MKQITVHVIPSFHYDVAFCKTYAGYLDQSFQCIEEGLRLLDKYPDFTFNIEQVILVREIWNRSPQLRPALKRFATEGRLIFAPGMFTMPDANIPSGESFIRNALLGRRWLQEHLGVVPTCCWMADVFGHAAQMPALASTCGFTSYMFERGKTGSWNTTFSWKGLDGTAIKTQWERDTYYGICLALQGLIDHPREWVENHLIDTIISTLSRHSPCPEILISPLGGDFHVPCETHVQFLHDLNRRRPDIQFVFSTPERYFAALQERGVKLLPERADLNTLFEGCYSSRIRVKQLNRALEETAGAVEALETATGASHDVSESLW